MQKLPLPYGPTHPTPILSQAGEREGREVEPTWHDVQDPLPMSADTKTPFSRGTNERAAQPRRRAPFGLKEPVPSLVVKTRHVVRMAEASCPGQTFRDASIAENVLGRQGDPV